jgi:hypothetical protein
MSWESIWNKLEVVLKETEPLDSKKALNLIFSWFDQLKKNPLVSNCKPFLEIIEKTGINNYTNLNLEEYDFKIDWIDLDDLVNNFLLKAPPRSFEHMITRVRDFLHDLLIYKSQISCPRCGDDDLRCYTNGEVVFFECDRCLYFVDQDLHPVRPPSKVIPCTKGKLKEFHLLRY